jgi:hypothetical protein
MFALAAVAYTPGVVPCACTGGSAAPAEQVTFIEPTAETTVLAGANLRIVWDTPLDVQAWTVSLLNSAGKDFRELSLSPVRESQTRWSADWQTPADLAAGRYTLLIRPTVNSPGLPAFVDCFSPDFRVTR